MPDKDPPNANAIIFLLNRFALGVLALRRVPSANPNLATQESDPNEFGPAEEGGRRIHGQEKSCKLGRRMYIGGDFCLPSEGICWPTDGEKGRVPLRSAEGPRVSHGPNLAKWAIKHPK